MLVFKDILGGSLKITSEKLKIEAKKKQASFDKRFLGGTSLVRQTHQPKRLTNFQCFPVKCSFFRQKRLTN